MLFSNPVAAKTQNAFARQPGKHGSGQTPERITLKGQFTRLDTKIGIAPSVPRRADDPNHPYYHEQDNGRNNMHTSTHRKLTSN
jgi:hypothetical protein